MRWLCLYFRMRNFTTLPFIILLFILKESSLKSLNDSRSIFGKSQVLRCFPFTLADLLFLDGLKTNLGYDFWLSPRQVGMPVDIMAGGKDLQTLKGTLDKRRISYTIFIEDVVSASTTLMIQNNKAKTGFLKGNGGFFDAYHTYEEIVEWMKMLKVQYSKEITLIKLGRTYEWREMYAIKLSGSNLHIKKPAIWIDGGVHGREWISPAVVTYMLNQLLTNSTYKTVLDKMDFYFLPVMNPDGYDYTFTEEGRLWRKSRSKSKSWRGCRGVDINRNWNFHWNNTNPKNSNPCSDNYCGEKAFSETEALHTKEQMMSSIWNLKGYLTYHSYAQLWLFPWGYTTDFVKDFADMESVSSAAVDAVYSYSGTRYKQQPYCVESDLCVYGNSIDYFKSLNKIKYCFLIQLPDLGTYGFLLPPSEIIPVGEESLRGMLVVAETILKEE